MRPPLYDSVQLRHYLRQQKIATLPELKQALGTSVDVTVFRKLAELHSLTSYTHRGRYYTLPEIPRFSDEGLWSWEAVWFSRFGTLRDTAEAFVNRSPQGYFAEELAQTVHAEVQEPLRELFQQHRLRRAEVRGRYLYTAAESDTHHVQLRSRLVGQAVPGVLRVADLAVSPNELRAATLLFYSLLDEQQRRLYAGLESLKLGRGGDTLLAEFLGVDPHTVARGRQQLLEQDVAVEGTRRQGAGRKATEKKRPKS